MHVSFIRIIYSNLYISTMDGLPLVPPIHYTVTCKHKSLFTRLHHLKGQVTILLEQSVSWCRCSASYIYMYSHVTIETAMSCDDIFITWVSSSPHSQTRSWWDTELCFFSAALGRHILNKDCYGHLYMEAIQNWIHYYERDRPIATSRNALLCLLYLIKGSSDSSQQGLYVITMLLHYVIMLLQC